MAVPGDIRAKIIGKSQVLLKTLKGLAKAAKTTANIIIYGETGTGKGVAAELAHRVSERPGPFVKINCTELSPALLESELFGHTRGSFTGAIRDHVGLFEQADDGTLFLDEIGEMPLELQAKLLSVVEDGAVRPVGSKNARRINVRLICATNRNLYEMVSVGKFRSDLLYRLEEYSTTMPSLRERSRDIVLLARSFQKKLFPTKSISRPAMKVLMNYCWYGNVRELRNILRRASIDAGRRIQEQHIRALLKEELIDEKAIGLSRAEHVLEVVQNQGTASADEIRSKTRLSKSTLNIELKKLVADGTLLCIGEGRTTRYVRPGIQRPVKIEPVLNQPQKTVLEHIGYVGRVTRRMYSAITGVAIRTAGHHLSDLVNKHLLISDGRRGRSHGYLAR